MKPAEIKRLDWWKYNAFFMLEFLLGTEKFNKVFGRKKNQLYAHIDSYLASQSVGGTKEVEELDVNISREEFLKLREHSIEPKVFRGAAKNWEAVQKWNLDFFIEEHGHKEIILTDNVGLSNQEFEKITLAQYINQIKSGALKYLQFSEIVNDDEKLKNNFDLKWLRQHTLPFSWGEDLKMFMGGKGSITPFHVGFSYFLFIQVMGKKKWILYPPNNRLYLDAKSDRSFYFYSNYNPKIENNHQFGLMKYATRYEVTLEPGDILWVPSFTWHYVENLTDTIGIRYGHTSIPAALKSSKQFTQLIFMATKPNLLTHFIVSRTKKRELEFIKSRRKK
ncbi:MAG: cupin-like domain-containing protein [Chitinophagales bacterium]